MRLVLRDVGSEISISSVVFGLNFNESLVHQVVTSYRSSSRSGTHSQKSRSDVSGSGKKPWRQKGTGRARSGSIRSPLWRSGGVTFAASPKSYKVKVNKKMYRGALKNIFSELVRKNRLILVREFSLEQPKTKLLIEKLKQIGLKDDVLILIDKLDENLFLSSRNLHKVKVCHVSKINPCILIVFDKIVVTERSIKKIEGMLI